MFSYKYTYSHTIVVVQSNRASPAIQPGSKLSKTCVTHAGSIESGVPLLPPGDSRIKEAGMLVEKLELNKED